MAKTDFLNSSDDRFAAQLQTFKTNLPGYAATLGVSAAQATAVAADADYLGYVLACQRLMQNGAQQWTTWKNLTRGGGNPPPTGGPVVPAFPTAVPAVAPGVEVRFRALVKQIKAHLDYNPSIGDALGIEGAERTAPDLSTVQPDLDVALTGNRVEIAWGWGGHGTFLELCEIQVDRADGKGFQLLTYDTTPGYVDTAPFPGTAARWSYRAIYRVGDAPVGQWSKTVSIMVWA